MKFNSRGQGRILRTRSVPGAVATG